MRVRRWLRFLLLLGPVMAVTVLASLAASWLGLGDPGGEVAAFVYGATSACLGLILADR